MFVGVAEVSVRNVLNSEACKKWKSAIESEMMNLICEERHGKL